MGREDVGGRCALTQSGSGGRTAGRARRSGPGGLRMQYLLSRACRPILKSLAQERTLCAFDFDGTLSPIAKHPSRAGMREKTRILLSCLAAQHPCVIVSGRAQADL